MLCGLQTLHVRKELIYPKCQAVKNNQQERKDQTECVSLSVALHLLSHHYS